MLYERKGRRDEREERKGGRENEESKIPGVNLEA